MVYYIIHYNKEMKENGHRLYLPSNYRYMIQFVVLSIFPILATSSIFISIKKWIRRESFEATAITMNSCIIIILSYLIVYKSFKRTPNKKLYFAFVKDCTHHQHHTIGGGTGSVEREHSYYDDYYYCYQCTRSYASFGGLRSLIFPSCHDDTYWKCCFYFYLLKTLVRGHSSTDIISTTSSSALFLGYNLTTATTVDIATLFQHIKQMVIPNTDIPSVSSVASENILSFLAFESDDSIRSQHRKHPTTAPPSTSSFPPPPSSSSSSPKIGNSKNTTTTTLEPATLIYHESARSIVFRDHVRTYVNSQQQSNDEEDSSQVSNITSNPIQELNSSNNKSQDIPESAAVATTKSTSPTNDNDNQQSIKVSLPNRSHHDEDTIHSNDIDSNNSNSRQQRDKLQHKNWRKRKDSMNSSQNSITSSIDSSIHNDDRFSHIFNDESAGGTKIHISGKPQVVIANYTPVINPLPSMELGAYNEFAELLQSKPFIWEEGEGPEKACINAPVWDTMNQEEKDVATMLLNQQCVVKTVKRADWTGFLEKFVVEDGDNPRHYLHPREVKTCTKEERFNKYSLDKTPNASFNSFMTSTSLFPSAGLKMRCYGSTKEYCLGVIFALPSEQDNDQEKNAKSTNSWCWPSGYAAKTEFNITESGDLINGREEALVSISTLRENNHTYIYEKSYEILGRMVNGGLKSVPYNELYLRVGGIGKGAASAIHRTFSGGIGLPIALFVRSAAYGDLIALMRTKQRMSSILGKAHMSSVPLFYISPDHGMHILTDNLQVKLLHIMTNSLNPFQNPTLQHKTMVHNTSESHLQQKIQELFDLDDDNIRQILTPEECARLAGGFGATDDSVAHLLMDAMIKDFEGSSQTEKCTHNLQNLVNEGLTSAVRSGDFNTSRQLLILYTLVAARGHQERDRTNSILSSCSLEMSESVKDQRYFDNTEDSPSPIDNHKKRLSREFSKRSSSVISESNLSQSLQKTSLHTRTELNKTVIPPPPPPPPLDTDRLRSATNSDGLLAVLGAAEVMKSMQNEAAKKRTLEAINATEEWINKSENSVSYRLAHWRDLTTAQSDLKIATEERSHLWDFVSSKAINNRKRFVEQLRQSVAATNFESISFLKSIYDMVSSMNSPCLRLELLQFILGLDNRYSVAHVARSVELAATCLNISAYEAIFADSEEVDEPYIVDD